MATKKSGSTAKRTTSAAKKTKQPAKGNKKPTKKELQARSQLYAILLFALGIFLFCLALVEGGSAWKFMHDLLRGCFSWCAFLIGPIVIYTAVMIALDRTNYPIGAKVISCLSLILLFSGALQIFSRTVPDGGILSVITELYESGKMLTGGGAFALLFGVSLLKWLGFAGAAITIVLLIFVMLMILSGGTLIGLFHQATRPVKKVEEVYHSAVENRAAAIEERHAASPVQASAIDIPIDDEPPARTERPAKKPATDPSSQVSRSREKLLDATEQVASHKKAPYSFEAAEEQPPAPPSVQQPMPEPVAASPKEELASDIDAIINRAVAGETTLSTQPLKTASGTLEFGQAAHPAPAAAPSEALASPASAPSAAASDSEAPVEKPAYAYPDIELLSQPKTLPHGDTTKELKANADRLVDTLKSFGVQTRITDISRGPAVTRYELQPSAGVKISRITNLADDIALNLAAAGVRIEAPIPNKAAIGIEVPNKVVSIVTIREIIDSTTFSSAKSRLTVALGRDISGTVTIADLAKMPHLLIAGSTGSGKSVCINSIIISLLYKSSPDEVKLILVDPKVVELGIYNGIPHLLVPVVTDPKKAAGTLAWAVKEMLERYKRFATCGVRDLQGYNRLAQTQDDLEPMPQIVIIIDELADLMMAAPKEIEDHICRLAQMARAAGMHLIIATQRPSADVITGTIKTNIASRIAFAVSSQIDSRIILDTSGAEKLLGRGDMLFCPMGTPKPQRVQGCLVTDAEVERVVEFVKAGGSASDYNKEVIEQIDREAAAAAAKGSRSSSSSASDDDANAADDLLEDAIQVVVEAGLASTSLLQRRLKVGYARAARLVDEMEQRGIVGPFEGSKPRKVLLTKEQYYERKLMNESVQQ